MRERKLEDLATTREITPRLFRNAAIFVFDGGSFILCALLYCEGGPFVANLFFTHDEYGGQNII